MQASIRTPAVAGTFYPAAAKALEREVRELMAGTEPEHDLLGCVSPHAGYVYSGRVAGRVLGQHRIPRRVVVLGPNHTGIGPAVSVASHHAWRTPLGEVWIDRDLAERLLGEDQEAELDDSAHWREHSIEVQLPFLQILRNDLAILPVCLRHLPLRRCVELGEALARVIHATPEPVGLVASSDMTHYEPDQVAREQDQLAIDAALTLDPAALYDTVHEHGITMCGVIPATVVLAAAARLGATCGELVAYQTSGDTSGDRSAVVGYAGIRFGT